MADYEKYKIHLKTIADRSGLAAVGRGLKGQINNVERLRRGYRGLKTITSGAFSAMRKGARITLTPVRVLAKGFVTLKATVLAFAGVSVKSAGDLEMLKAQLEAVMESTEAANKAFEESNKFSVKTPFDPAEIVKTRILLEGVGISGQEAVEDVARAAAALDRNILDIGSALISLETEPLRRLGIQLKRDGDEFVFSYKDKMKRAREVTVDSYEDAQQALLNIFEEKFTGGLARMARTWQGKISTLKGAWRDWTANFGDGIIEPLKNVLDDLIRFFENTDLSKLGKDLGKEIAEARVNLLAAFETARTISEKIRKNISGEEDKGLDDIIRTGLTSGGQILMRLILEAFTLSFGIWKSVGKILAGAFREELLDVLTKIPVIGGKVENALLTETGMTDEKIKRLAREEAIRATGVDPLRSGIFMGEDSRRQSRSLDLYNESRENIRAMALENAKKSTIDAAGPEILKEMERIPEKISESINRIENEVEEGLADFSDALGEATGDEDFSITGEFDKNKALVRKADKNKSRAAEKAEPEPTEPDEKTTEPEFDVHKDFDRFLRLRENQARMQRLKAARPEIEEYREAQGQYEDYMGRAGDISNLSERSFTRKRAEKLQANMEREEAEAVAAMEKAGATISQFSSVMQDLAKRISTLEGQIQAYDA